MFFVSRQRHKVHFYISDIFGNTDINWTNLILVLNCPICSKFFKSFDQSKILIRNCEVHRCVSVRVKRVGVGPVPQKDIGVF